MNAFVHFGFVQSMLLAIATIVGLLVPGISSAQSVGEKATFTDLTTFDGTTLKAEVLKGRPVLLYFWASWCPICVNEMPLLKKTYAKYKNKGFEIVAISFREETTKSQAFYKGEGFEFPGGPIDATYNANYPNLRGTPTWFLVDREGVIRKKIVGSQDVRWELEKGLLPLL
jgi:cytochrome c biogenesis protein CcmG, thiol:disulfide interchange protein DsbE